MAARQRLWRWVLLALAVAAVFCGAAVAYTALGPGPLDFAGGRAVALAGYQGPDPTGVPASLANAGLLERGKYLTAAADCVGCHTAKDGTPFVGGRAFVLPFGTLYSTNLTPDAETGIGKYTDADFLNAVHKGIGRGGRHLYPAMPYASYTYMSDADALAIKAYLSSLKPFKAPTPPDTLAFPFNQRWSMAFWNALFSGDERYRPRPERSPEWNRGAYLAEAMEHCGECHTPRNTLFSLNNRSKFSGEIQAGWRAFNITGDAESGVGRWTEAELRSYLLLGHSPRYGTATGPMVEAVDDSLSRLDPKDVQAIATYLKSIPPVHSRDLPPPKLTAAPDSPAAGIASVGADGERIYAQACAGCHGWTGVDPALPFADLVGTRSVNDPSGINVAQVILNGSPQHPGERTSTMPAFGETYSDSEVASVVDYVTARFGALGSKLGSMDVARLRAAD